MLFPDLRKYGLPVYLLSQLILEFAHRLDSLGSHLKCTNEILLRNFLHLTHQNLNLLLNQMLELPVETVLIPGEPFGFATLYLLFYTVLSELAAKLRDRKEKRGKRVK